MTDDNYIIKQGIISRENAERFPPVHLKRSSVSPSINRPSWFITFWYQFIKDPQNLIALSLFTLQLFLVYAELLPNLSNIYFWDEALYINYGRLLTEGTLPPLTDNPFTAAFYALTYLPFINLPYWMVQSCSLGRILLFCLLWLGSWLVARQLTELFKAPYMMGIVFISPVITNILVNPSDSLFAATSCFGLWQLLKYHRSHLNRHLWLGSLFISLSALSRNDGLILFAIFFLLVLFISRPLKSKIKSFFVAIIIFFLIVGGYVIGRGLLTGDYQTGIRQRSYIAFRQGHDIAFREEDIAAQQPELDTLFGTEEENGGSYFIAIMRHPAAYFDRLQAIVKSLPVLLLDAYNKKMALIIFLLAIRGIIDLFQRKKFTLLLILAGWHVYLLVYFLSFFRIGYLWTPFVALFTLTATGLEVLLRNLEKRRERIFWTIFLLVFCIYGLATNKLAVYAGAGTFLLGIWLVYFIQSNYSQLPQIRSIVAVLFLCIGLIIRGNFPSPKLQLLGQSADEKAVRYLIEHLDKGSTVAAGAPGAVWAAKMNYQQLNKADVPGVENSQQLYQWLVNNNIKAIYMDYHLATNAPYFYDPIINLNGNGLERVFIEDEGSVQVFFVKTPANETK